MMVKKVEYPYLIFHSGYMAFDQLDPTSHMDAKSEVCGKP